MPDQNPMPHPMPGPRPNYRPVYIARTVACRPVYDNQNVIDALNGLLANCDKLSANSGLNCGSRFVRAVENELQNQLAKARYIGQSCDTVNPIVSPVITRYRY